MSDMLLKSGQLSNSILHESVTGDALRVQSDWRQSLVGQSSELIKLHSRDWTAPVQSTCRDGASGPTSGADTQAPGDSHPKVLTCLSTGEIVFNLVSSSSLRRRRDSASREWLDILYTGMGTVRPVPPGHSPKLAMVD